jgi:hypothetical protein
MTCCHGYVRSHSWQSQRHLRRFIGVCSRFKWTANTRALCGAPNQLRSTRLGSATHYGRSPAWADGGWPSHPWRGEPRDRPAPGFLPFSTGRFAPSRRQPIGSSRVGKQPAAHFPSPCSAGYPGRSRNYGYALVFLKPVPPRTGRAVLKPAAPARPGLFLASSRDPEPSSARRS